MSLSTQIRRVAIKDYKSIASCDVNLGPLTFLVGPNGSGKSNFLDALGFVADALRYSLDYAVRERGGINEIVRRSAAGQASEFAIRLDIELEPEYRFEYFVAIGVGPTGGSTVRSEECNWWQADVEEWSGHFCVRDGKVIRASFQNPPLAAADRLYLVTLSGHLGPALLYPVLSSMGLYRFNPDSIRELQSPSPNDLLAGDGSNLAAILSALAHADHSRVERIIEFLRLIVPTLETVRPLTLGPKETLEFVEHANGSGESSKFYASSMSDGTLRALGILVALFQQLPDNPLRPLVAIEEPEIALHPGAAEVLLACLQEASLTRQVLVTTHSPDLLDRKDIDVESILAVSADDGETRIAPVDKASREVMKERMWTAGQLLRINQLEPDGTKITGPSGLQMRIFE